MPMHKIGRKSAYMQNSLELWLVRFMFSKEDEEGEEDGKSCLPVFRTLRAISYNFLHAVTF